MTMEPEPIVELAASSMGPADGIAPTGVVARRLGNEILLHARTMSG
jgi:hypothetical protein